MAYVITVSSDQTNSWSLLQKPALCISKLNLPFQADYETSWQTTAPMTMIPSRSTITCRTSTYLEDKHHDGTNRTDDVEDSEDSIDDQRDLFPLILDILRIIDLFEMISDVAHMIDHSSE